MLVLSIAVGVFLGTLPLCGLLFWLFATLFEQVGTLTSMLAREAELTEHHRDLVVEEISARERERERERARLKDTGY